MKARRAFLLWAPFALAGLGLLVWHFMWRAGAAAMRSAIDDFAADVAEGGGAVSHAPMRARGFPFFLRGEIDDFSIAREGYRVETRTLYLHAAPGDPGRIVFSASPAMRLTTPAGDWSIRADGARASIERDRDGWLFKAETAAIEALKGGEAVMSGRAVINIAPADAGAWRISLRVLGAAISNARGEASIPRLDAAMTAREEPRTVEIHGFDGEIGAARLGLQGALAQDGDGFAAGRLDAAIENPAALIDALAVIGAVKPETRGAVESGLQILAAAGGGRISAPIEVRGGVVRVAGVRIADAPRLGQP